MELEAKMGEAKRRAATGGAAKLAPIGRGLLFPHLLQSIPNGLTTRQLNDDSLNSAILYWDKIACPTNNFLHVRLRGEETLTKEGLLIRPRTTLAGTFEGSQLHGFLTKAQISQFKELEIQAPGFWAFAEGTPHEFEHNTDFVRARTALVELVSALPLPPDETPIDSLLEFKLKRLPELKRLRHAVDETYLKIADSGDPQAAVHFHLTEIDKACSDAAKTAKEWWKNIKLGDLKSLVTLGGGAAGAALGFSVQMPGTAAFVGGAGAAIGIAQGISAKFKADRKLPFWYAAEVKRRFP